jgi:hypothetical protein
VPGNKQDCGYQQADVPSQAKPIGTFGAPLQSIHREHIKFEAALSHYNKTLQIGFLYDLFFQPPYPKRTQVSYVQFPGIAR